MSKKILYVFLSISLLPFFSFKAFANNDSVLKNTYIEMEKADFAKSSFGYTDETLQGGMIEFKNGVISGKIDDFDNDSKNELIVFKIEQGGAPLETEDIYGRKKSSGKVTAEMYEEENGKAIKTDSFSALEFLNSDAGEYVFFIKKENGQKYIGIQNISYSSCFADGLIFDAQICAYNGKNFENKLSLSGGGSSFDFNTYYTDEMKALRAMGFSTAVNQMLEGYTIINLTKYDGNIEKITEAFANTNSTALGEIYGYSNLEKTVKEHGIVNVTLNNYTTIDGTADMLKTISVILNGKELKFKQPPYIENGITMVPIRTIFEALDLKINFNVNTKTITTEKNGKSISMTIGTDIAYINSKPIKLNTRIKIINGSSMVPLRLISETFDAEVNYNGIDKIITITTSDFR